MIFGHQAVNCPELLFEAVFEQHAAIEDKVVRLAVLRVQAEVAHAHELIARSRMRRAAFCRGQFFRVIPARPCYLSFYTKLDTTSTPCQSAQS